MSVIDELVSANRAAAESRADAPASGVPSRAVAIVACMDCRIDVERALGLGPGEAHVLRNAGGAVTEDVIRSLALSQHKLGTRAVMLIHHDKCGAGTITEDGFRAELREATGMTPPFAIESFEDVEDDVRQSIERVRHSAFLPHRDQVRGFVYDVDTGLLREVEAAGPGGGSSATGADAQAAAGDATPTGPDPDRPAADTNPPGEEVV
jgi:carbonic anhydrase